jgi:hypothetical protein
MALAKGESATPLVHHPAIVREGHQIKTKRTLPAALRAEESVDNSDDLEAG